MSDFAEMMASRLVSPSGRQSPEQHEAARRQAWDAELDKADALEPTDPDLADQIRAEARAKFGPPMLVNASSSQSPAAGQSVEPTPAEIFAAQGQGDSSRVMKASGPASGMQFANGEDQRATRRAMMAQLLARR